MADSNIAVVITIVFVHITAPVDCYAGIKEGDRVEFEIGEHRGRACAESVSVLD